MLELGELWSFVFRKGNQRWVWLALCRRTRQVVAFFVGDRSERSCWDLWQRVPATDKRCHTYSDFWHAYANVLDTLTHHPVTKRSGQTNHVERFNTTLRQRLARFVRKTLSFSKSDQMHQVVLTLFLYTYNIQCIS